MGHSARAKFKREIRVQRLSTVTGTEKDQLKKDAVQLALERAAAAPKIPLKSKRPSVSKEVKRTASDMTFDEETIELVKETMKESVEAARWGVTAPACLKTKKGPWLDLMSLNLRMQCCSLCIAGCIMNRC